MKYIAAIFFAGAAFGQQYEMGADLGYGLYRDGSIYSASGTAKAGIRNRFATGIFLADQFSKYVTAEFDYVYHDGHPPSGARSEIRYIRQFGCADVRAAVPLQAARTCWRPFLAGGTGAKEYVIAGPAPFPQPIPQIASLTTNDVWKVVFSVGVTPLFGVSYTF